MEASNVKAMREALEMMSALFEQGVICTSYANSAEEMEQIEELYRKAKAALAAPPRNCDRFATREEARNYFDDFVCLRSNGSGAIDCKGCPLDSIDNPHRADCREAWIFAPAERKGESDGR